MESVSSDTRTSVLSSSESVIEPPNTRKFETSISVLSLTEKFEKSGDFSKSLEKTLTEDNFVSKRKMKKSYSLPEIKSVSDTNGYTALPSGKCKVETIFCKNENSLAKNSKIDISGIITVENFKKTEVKILKISTDPETSVKEVMNTSKAYTSTADEKNLNCVSQEDSVIFTELQPNIEFQERVMHFIKKIPNSAQNSISDIMPIKDDSGIPRSHAKFILNESKKDALRRAKTVALRNAKKTFLKILEQSIIDALHMVNSENESKTTDTPVPSIQITDARDREDSSSNDSEGTKSENVKTKVKTSEKHSDTTHIKENERVLTTATSQWEGKDQFEVSAEERKAYFYISSSDLNTDPLEESVGNSSELDQSSETACLSSTRTDESNETRSSYLRLEICQEKIFVVSCILTAFGCMLYCFARERMASEFCEYLGLIIAILSGIIEAVSLYSCLDIFPGPSSSGNEVIQDTGYIPFQPLQNETASASAHDLDASWSFEKERAFRRENRMSSIRTSEASLKSELDEYVVIKKSEHLELIDKTEVLKKGVMELLDLFNAFMPKMEPVDKLVEI